METALDPQNWLLVGLAGLKVLSYFWPVALLAVWYLYAEYQHDRSEQAKSENAKQPYKKGPYHFSKWR